MLPPVSSYSRQNGHRGCVLKAERCMWGPTIPGQVPLPASVSGFLLLHPGVPPLLVALARYAIPNWLVSSSCCWLCYLLLIGCSMTCRTRKLKCTPPSSLRRVRPPTNHFQAMNKSPSAHNVAKEIESVGPVRALCFGISRTRR